jgi:hypothetical protein
MERNLAIARRCRKHLPVLPVAERAVVAEKLHASQRT